MITILEKKRVIYYCIVNNMVKGNYSFNIKLVFILVVLEQLERFLYLHYYFKLL